jgi:3-hydroxybutyrate dehydrogenase
MSTNSQRRVLITGGTGSVGRALIAAFAARGHDVTFQYHQNQSQADELSVVHGATAVRVAFDDGPIQIPRRDFDILVNNAAVNISNALTKDVTWADWRKTLAVNLDVPFLLVQLCLPHMIANRWGRIVNISSIYGLRAVSENLPYTVSKHALSGLTKTVAKEYGQSGIACNEICPGPIESDMIDRIARDQARRTGTTVDEYMTGLRNEVPMGRLATPQEIAALAVFLSSDEAAYLSGASVPIDGGLIA